MKLHYDPETASLCVELQSRPSAETREITDDVRLDLHEAGRAVGLDIDHASAVLDLKRLEATGLPLKVTVIGAVRPQT